MRFEQGTTTEPPFSATFRNYLGVPTDPSEVHVDVYDSSNTLVVDADAPTHVSLGVYEYTYDFANDAPLGLWRIVWTATIDGVLADPADEYFEIVASGEVVVTSDMQRLRRMVGERIPVGQTADDTFFSDEEIADLLVQANNDFNRAAMNGWLDKMAEYAKLIDRNTSGADLPLSQMYKQAASMFDHYAKLIGENAAAYAGRVVGRAINLREDNCSQSRVMTGSATYRPELRNTTARRLLQQNNPDTMEEDPTYPQVGLA